MWLSISDLIAGWSGSLLAQAPASSSSSGAGSPFTDYTAAVVGNVMLVAFLVIVLVGGGLLILNLGLLSKRREDQTGRRTPSDVAILKHSTWPETYDERTLPALDGDDDEENVGRSEEQPAVGHRVLRSQNGNIVPEKRASEDPGEAA